MSKILVNIPYLEVDDINAQDCSLKQYVNNGKPAIVMVQGEFCHFCTDAKPSFQELAKSLPEVCVATVQIDGGPSEQAAAKLLRKVNSAQGVPAYLIFGPDGKFVKMHEGGRDIGSLRAAFGK